MHIQRKEKRCFRNRGRTAEYKNEKQTPHQQHKINTD